MPLLRAITSRWRHASQPFHGFDQSWAPDRSWPLFAYLAFDLVEFTEGVVGVNLSELLNTLSGQFVNELTPVLRVNGMTTKASSAAAR